MRALLNVVREHLTSFHRGTPTHRPSGARATRHVRVGNPWHAVSIAPCAGACSLARSMSGHRFLSSEAPPALPLVSCDADQCACRYRHHADRRGASSRRTPLVTIDNPIEPRRRADDEWTPGFGV